MPIDSHLPQADPFSLVPTFKVYIGGGGGEGEGGTLWLKINLTKYLGVFLRLCKKNLFLIFGAEAVNGIFQMQGGKNWILSKYCR